MKKLIFLMTFGLLVCAIGYTAEYKTHNCAISFSNVTSNYSQNVLSGVKHFSTDSDTSDSSSKLNDIYHKYRITKKGSINFIIAGGVCSGLGTLMLASGMIMGMVPYSDFPDSMKVYDHYVYGDSDLWYVDYPYMTAFASAGISMVLTGALMFLFCMPLLIYGSIALYDYNKAAKQNTVTFNGNGLTIQLDNLGRRRI